MRHACCAAMALFVAAPGWGAEVQALSRTGNRVVLKLDAGEAEMNWAGPVAFRFRRSFTSPLPQAPRQGDEEFELRVDELPGEIAFTTRHLKATVRKRGLQVRVQKPDGTVIFEDLRPPEYSGGAVRLERAAEWGVSFYGLGPRADASLNARGRVVRAGVPFLLSTAGYAEYFRTPASYTYDMLAADRYRVEARGPALLDYYFAHGSPLKDVFEELHEAGVDIPEPAPAKIEATWEGLREALLRELHGSLSGVKRPRFDEAAFRQAPAELRESARQLAGVMIPGVRKDLAPYSDAYELDVRHRGLALVRAMPYQYPQDREAADYSGQFVFGDDLLVSPVLAPGGKRFVYIPMGIWTRLDTGEAITGRREIAVESPDLLLFARNGTILPLQRNGLTELHYFPRLGAQFFIYEEAAGDYTQIHAAPAGEIVRLQIEPVRDRNFLWVVRHMERPASVGFEDRTYAEVVSRADLRHETWFYDAPARSIYVQVRVAAGEDRIVNLSFQTPSP